MKPNLAKLYLVLIIASAFTWQCIGAWQDSQTTDEAVHLTAGLSYWQTGSFRLNPEHPSLFKLWASLPLHLLPNTQITNLDQTQWLVGIDYLYHSTAQEQYNSRFLLVAGRFPMILIWLGLILTTMIYSWRRWGPWSAVAVTAVLAYDPNFLGHGHLITNDVATAFAYLGACLTLNWFIEHPSWKRLGIFSSLFSVALLTKFSTIVLWLVVPIIGLMAIIYQRPNFTWRWWWRLMLGCLVVTTIMTWLAYGGKFTRINADPLIDRLWQTRSYLVNNHLEATVPTYTRLFIHLADPDRLSGKVLTNVQHWSIPAYAYWYGFFSAFSHNAYGHAAYLLGHVSELGWWYYFPVAMGVKTPILTLFLLLVWLIISVAIHGEQWRKKRWAERVPFDFWILVFPPLLFFLWSMTSHINIGFRHIFATYVFFPLAAGSALHYLHRRGTRWIPGIAMSIAIVTMTVGTLAWPNTIGYFNGFAGGAKNGWHYVTDSNLDWGQDYIRLHNFFDQQKFSEVHVALFGSVPSNVYFPEATGVMRDDEITAGLHPSGIIAVSYNELYFGDTSLTWLRSQAPTWRIGSSILVFDFR